MIIDRLRDEIVSKVKAAAGVDARKIALCLPKETFRRRRPKSAIKKQVVVIGASTGGGRAVAEVLSGLPRDISPAIIIVQHMGKEFVP